MKSNCAGNLFLSEHIYIYIKLCVFINILEMYARYGVCEMKSICLYYSADAENDLH